MQRDGEDCATLYDRYADRVYRFCYRLCGNRADAEDLAADTFMVALRRPGMNLATLFGVALNKWRMLSRKRAVRQRVSRLVPLTRHVDVQDRIALDDAIDNLPDALRTAFILVKVEGFTNAEAGAILARPTGTVQSQVFTACEKLRRALSDAPQGMPAGLEPAEEIGK